MIRYYLKATLDFEPRCWDQFWSKHSDKLIKLKYRGNLSFEERQKEMIVTFQNFRQKWEDKAREMKKNFYLVSDNPVYDGGFINQMIFDYTKDMPIPYDMSRSYETFFDVHSMQKGFLMAKDPSFMNDWSFNKYIETHYDLPKREKEMTHDPSDDAYSIAYDFHILQLIQKGKIQNKK